jgi:hypothetical protein
MRYRVIDCPTNGTVGQDCGSSSFAELPSRLQAAILADPEASEWTFSALSKGDSGEELIDLRVLITREE